MKPPLDTTLHLDEVVLYERYCEDPTADNCIEFADGAVPVYLAEEDDGPPALLPGQGRPDRPYGHLHVLYDPHEGARPVVVLR